MVILDAHALKNRDKDIKKENVKRRVEPAENTNLNIWVSSFDGVNAAAFQALKLTTMVKKNLFGIKAQH